MNRKIYVGNLPTTFDELDLEKLFKNHGIIVSAKIFHHHGPDWLGKYGYVEMSSKSEANSAIEELSNQNVTGRRITVAHIVPR